MICELANQAFLARVDIPTCRAISNLKTVITPIKRSELINSQTDMAPSHSSQLSDSVFCYELNLSSINPPSNKMQRLMDVIEIEDQNAYGPESNFDCINVGGNMRSFVLHQVRDQIF